MEVLGFDNTRDIDQTELLKRIFADFIVIFISTFGVENLSCFKKKIFVIFKLVDFGAELQDGSGGSFQFLKHLVHIFFNLIHHSMGTHLMLFDI